VLAANDLDTLEVLMTNQEAGDHLSQL